MALHVLMNICMAKSIFFFVQNRNELFKKHKQQTAAHALEVHVCCAACITYVMYVITKLKANRI